MRTGGGPSTHTVQCHTPTNTMHRATLMGMRRPGCQPGLRGGPMQLRMWTVASSSTHMQQRCRVEPSARQPASQPHALFSIGRVTRATAEHRCVATRGAASASPGYSGDANPAEPPPASWAPELQQLINSIPYKRLAIWGFVGALAAQLADFFGVRSHACVPGMVHCMRHRHTHITCVSTERKSLLLCTQHMLL